MEGKVAAFQDITELKKHNQYNVLITSISKKVSLIKLVKEAIDKFGGTHKVYGGDIKSDSIGSYFVDEFWEMPELNSLSIEKLIKFCQEHKIRYIIPSRDGELIYFAKYKDVLFNYDIHVMVSNLSSIELVFDKYLFAKKLLELNYPVIPTELSIEELGISSSIVVKERFGAGSERIGLNLNEDKAILHAGKLESPIFQPYIEGEEYSVDLYITSKKETKGVIVRKRDLVVNGESQITTTLRNSLVEEVCSKLAVDLNLYGHIVLQLKIDSNGVIYIIEVNARFGGASRLSIAAGLDSFYWFFLENSRCNIDNFPFIRKRKELKMIRFPEDLIIEGVDLDV